MEKRKETMSALKVCRFCLCQDNSLSCLYEGNQKFSKNVSLPLKILSCLSIEVFPSDRMPTFICNRCSLVMELFHDYKQLCRTADQRILHYIQSGTVLEPVVWPESLTKVFRFAFKALNREQIVKTVMEGGATVQVTSHEGSNSDEEEDEGNVYNIKIGDAADGSKCIEVLNSKNDDSKEIIKKNKKEFNTIPRLARHVRAHAGERRHPCKYCDKSFMKSHHYTRHLRVKHRDTMRASRGQLDNYRCEQCEETFATQDELIYHSAIHATQNLTCPLCQEKFENVEAVTAHIKSHVNGTEFMCDLCELVFTTKEKLDNHITLAHADEITEELEQDESTMEMDQDEFDVDNGLFKEGDSELALEMKKTSQFLTPLEAEEKPENTNSEESEVEATYTELTPVDTLTIVRKEVKATPEPAKEVQSPISQPKQTLEVVKPAPVIAPAPVSISEIQTASILRKAEEVKRKVQLSSEVTIKKLKTAKPESISAVVGASDKSLRLLEKELQELKRTNTRTEPTKTPAKPVEAIRNRRPQLYTSTPKPRSIEERKAMLTNKLQAVEKKIPERRALTKENKEPKETKEVRLNVVAAKDDNKEVKEKEAKEKEAREKEVKEKEIKEKEVKEKEIREIKEKEAKEREIKEKEAKEKEVKEKETPKTIVKNGGMKNDGPGDKSQPEESIRRSTRPSKIKDYAKMVADKSQDSMEDDDSDDDIDNSKDSDKIETGARAKPKRGVVKAAKAPVPVTTAAPPAPAAPAPAPATPAARKRGRPRKDTKQVPAKIKKDNADEESPDVSKEETSELDDAINKTKELPANEEKVMKEDPLPLAAAKPETSEAKSLPSLTDQIAAGSQIMSPTGQTLKKVPIKSIPPGIKPLPLPVRPMGTTGELCEMQIGKKVVKVQKIVMTKAEVEAMAKKGLVEMKDGTMVLKQGIKLSSTDGLKSTLLADKDPSKQLPSRADIPTASKTNANEST